MDEPEFHPVEARPLEGRRLWLRYSDGVEGVADLSHLAGNGVFRIWDAPGVFEAARVTPHGSIAWGDDVEICADALYLEITGKSVEEVMPRAAAVNGA